MKVVPLLFAACIVLSLDAHMSFAAAAAEKKQEVADTPTPQNTTRCRVDIFYSWRSAEKSDGKGGTAEREVEKKEVFASQHSETAATEDEAKKKLSEGIPRWRAEAAETCVNIHQKQSTCVVQALQRAKTTYQSLDFQGRRALLSAIQEDCSAISGACGDIRVSEFVCSKTESGASAPADSTESAESSGKTKGKRK